MSYISSLERKYQLAKGNINNRDLKVSEREIFNKTEPSWKQDHRSTFKDDIPKTNPNIRESWKKDTTGASYDTPIKRLKNQSDSTSIHPRPLYKYFDKPSLKSDFLLKTSKKNIRPKNELRSSKSVGIFNRLREYLKNITSKSLDDFGDLNRLEKSARNLLSIPKSMDSNKEKKLLFDKNFLASTNHYDENESILDEVASYKAQQKNISNIKNFEENFQKAYNREKSLNSQLRKDFKERYRQLEKAFSTENERLSSELKIMKERLLSSNSKRRDELESMKKELKVAESAILAEKDRKINLMNKEKQQLVELVRVLKEKHRDMKFERQAIEAQKEEMERKARAYESLDKKKEEILERLKKSSSNELHKSITHVREQFRQEEEELLKERALIEGEIRSNEQDQIRYFDKLIEYSSMVLSRERPESGYLITDFEKLLDMMNSNADKKGTTKKYANARAKFEEYSDFFKNFTLLYGSSEIHYIPQEYSISNLKRIDHLFLKLKESFVHNKGQNIEKLNFLKNQLPHGTLDPDTEIRHANYKIASERFSKITRILTTQLLINDLMRKLASLVKSLHKIMLYREFQSDLSRSDEDRMG